MKRGLSLVAVLLLLASSLFVNSVEAAPIGTDAFWRTWARTDKPVSELKVNRTWMWGQEAFSGILQETYDEAPGHQRTVQYFDKTRMEDNSYRESAPWDVTNGLLAKDLMTGRIQVGDNRFDERSPAQINVAGDANDSNGPTYATFQPLMGYQPIPNGWLITQTVNRAGQVGDDQSLASYGVTAAQNVNVSGINHTIASVFWDFMNSSGLVHQGGTDTTASLFENPYYATGYPLTEAYWTNVLVGGISKQVLVQVFERRVLTFTPSNPDGWKVEAGNVGQHYYTWLYGNSAPTPPSNGIPVEGGILYQSSLADWPTQYDETGNVGAWLEDENGYHILAYPGETFIADKPEMPMYGDASYSVDMWGIAGGGDSFGCLSIKWNLEGVYLACIAYNPASALGTVAFYLDLVTTGDDVYQELGTFPFTVSTPANQPHNLKVLTRGSQFWFLIDGAFVGQASHEGTSVGYVALSVVNVDDFTESIAGFRNLTIRSVEGGTTSNPPSTPEPPSPTCDPAYPGVCIPPKSQVGDLNCDDISHRDFVVLPPDPHGFDSNANGIGCES